MVILRDTGTAEQPVPSAARTTSGSLTAGSHYASVDSIRAQLNVTAVSGTSPTLNVVIEDSLDAGVTWNTIGTFAQRTAAGREVINITIPFGSTVRVSWTIGGTTPSFTFVVDWFIQ